MSTYNEILIAIKESDFILKYSTQEKLPLFKNYFL